MTPEISPFDAAISELEGRIKTLQNTLETLKQLRAGGDAAQASISTTLRPGDTEVQHDSFFGMTIGDATQKYLNMVKTTKSTAEIADALERGGLKHSSKDFNMTIRSILGPREEFVRVNRDWGLTEWYRGVRKDKKAKLSKTREPEAPVTPKKTKPRKRPKSTKATSKPAVMDNSGPKESRRSAILKLFVPGKELTLKQMAEITRIDRKIVKDVAYRLVVEHKLRRVGLGKYALPDAVPSAA